MLYLVNSIAGWILFVLALGWGLHARRVSLRRWAECLARLDALEGLAARWRDAPPETATKHAPASPKVPEPGALHPRPSHAETGNRQPADGLFPEARGDSLAGSQFPFSAGARGSSVNRPQQAARRVDSSNHVEPPRPTLISVPDLASRPMAPPHQPPEELTQRYGEIWEMAEDGVALRAIAKQTGYPIGQVELILGLKRPSAVPPARMARPTS